MSCRGDANLFDSVGRSLIVFTSTQLNDVRGRCSRFTNFFSPFVGSGKRFDNGGSICEDPGNVPLLVRRYSIQKSASGFMEDIGFFQQSIGALMISIAQQFKRNIFIRKTERRSRVTTIEDGG